MPKGPKMVFGGGRRQILSFLSQTNSIRPNLHHFQGIHLDKSKVQSKFKSTFTFFSNILHICSFWAKISIFNVNSATFPHMSAYLSKWNQLKGWKKLQNKGLVLCEMFLGCQPPSLKIEIFGCMAFAMPISMAFAMDLGMITNAMSFTMP